MLAIKTTQKFLLIFVSFVAVVVLCLLFCFFVFFLLCVFWCICFSCCFHSAASCAPLLRGGDGGETVFRCVFNHKTNYAALQATSAAATAATSE